MGAQLELTVGTQIRTADVKYKLIQEVGRGGNCVVWLVMALKGSHQGMLFALKVFTKTDDAERAAQFEEEANFLYTAQHAALMRVFDRGVYRDRGAQPARDCPFIVAEYLPYTLENALAGNRISIAEKLIFTLQLLSALKYLDAQAVIHRDIKPENIFIKGRSCLLGDFGLMKKVLGEEVGKKGDILKLSGGAGMPYFYRTPDLVKYANNVEPITTKSDVFQLGLVFARMFTGTNPSKRPANILDPVELFELKPIPGTAGPQIQTLIQRMLEPDAARREPASELIDEWEGVLSQTVTQYHVLEGRVFI